MKAIYLLLFLIITKITLTDAQTRDDTFNEPIPVRPARIQCIKVLSDGKILLGGDIAFYKTTPVNNLIRLNSDYTLDNSFSFPGIKALLIKNIEIQSTGDIIVLAQGYKSLINYYDFNFSLYQLEPDGIIKKQIDTLSNVNSITIQSDNKVLVGGGISPNGYLYRFNSDFSADQAFNNKVSFNNLVSCVEVNANNIFVGGRFTRVGGKAKNNIVKLKPDGTIDNTFDTGSGTNDNIGSLTFQADGKILIGGSYINSFNGTQCRGMVRLNPDGSLDTGFNPPFLNGGTSEITVADTTIYAAAPLHINAQNNFYLFRLQPDGSMDPGFEPFMLDAFGSIEFCMAITQNNLIFNNSSTTGSIFGLSECDSVGNLIKTFNPEVVRFGSIKAVDYINGRLVIAGDFMKVNGVTTYGLALLNKNGSMDPTFLMNKNLGPVTQLKILNDCSLLVSTGSDFFKVDATGKIKSDFTFQHFKTLYQVIKFKVLDDGKIIAGDPNNIYRLNSNGTEDPTFNIGTGICCSVYTSFDFDLQGDKVIYGSIFNQFNGRDVNRLVRLNPDASVDNTFKTGTGPDDAVTMIKVLDSGEMIIGGSFKNFNGTVVPNRIIKLSKDGAVDSTFIKNQKLSTFFGGIETNFAKVEQVDSMIYVKGVTSVSAFNVNGTIYNDFKIPLNVNQINDIVTVKDSSQDAGGKKSTTASKINSYMFAVGSFNNTENDILSFVVKFTLGNLPFLSVSLSTLDLLTPAGNSATFEILSNMSWEISCDQSWLTISNPSGSASTTITMTSLPNTTSVSRTATLTITGKDGKSQIVTVIQPGNEAYSNSEIRVYPIPVVDKLYISFLKMFPQTSISIFSVTGQSVYSSNITNIITEVDLSPYASGVYFIRIVSKNGETIIKKIIKQ